MNMRSSLMAGWTIVFALTLAMGQESLQPTSIAGAPQNPQVATQSSAAAPQQTEVARRAPATALHAFAGMESDAGAGDTFRDLPQIPSLLGGKGMSLAFLTEMERSNYLRAGFNVGAAYDDNPLLLAGKSVGNVSGSFFPNLSLEQTTPRTRLTFGYAGGLTVNQRFTKQNQGSHDLIFDSEYRMTPHVNLRVAEEFHMLTGVFDTSNGNGGAGGSGGPNVSLLAPLATQKSSLTTVETNYHFALNDLVGASGSFYDLRFGDSQPGILLSNTQTATGVGFWLHRLFRSDWGGLSYRFQRITFDPSGETRVHTFMLVDTLKLTNRVSLSAFAGPEYNHNQIAGEPTVTNWSVAGGVEGGWQDARTSVSAGYSREISDGGGVLGAVRLQNVHGSFRQQIVPGWAFLLKASHGTNNELSSTTSVKLTSAGAGVERRISNGLGVRFSYTHDFQQREGLTGTPPAFDAHRNRLVVTLSYQWAKSLGM